MALDSFDESTYKTLIGLAEFFRCSQPPRIRECIHCLQATLGIKDIPPLLEAKGRLSIAKLLLQYTRNVGHARSHLEQAHQLASYLTDTDASKIFFESASSLAVVCAEQNQSTLAKNILQSALERSASSPLKNWHYRLIFQLAEAHAHDKEVNVAIDLLSMIGVPTARENGHHYIRLLYLLSKCLLLLATKDLRKFEQSLMQTETIMDQWAPNASSPMKREVIKVFCRFLKVYYYVITGRPKTGKTNLKELQQSIQLLTSLPEENVDEEDPESFQWMSKDHLCILVYLVTVMHSMHAGFMDKALRYTEKALSQIEKLKAVGSENQLTLIFQLSLLEHAVMCRIVQGQGANAIQDIGKACQVCKNDPKLMTLMKPAIHTMLGLYAMSMNLMADSEEHFKKVLKVSNNTCDVYSVAVLNLAIIYTREGASKQYALRELLSYLDGEAVSRSKNLRASYFYMMGLKTFFDSNYEDSKKYLRESLRIGNTEDLNRMTACSLVLLGHVVTSLANPQEALTMILPAMQVANRIPDVYLQLWASSLLKDMYRMLGDTSHEQEGAQLHHMYTTQLLQDHFLAGQRPEHGLLKDFI